MTDILGLTASDYFDESKKDEFSTQFTFLSGSNNEITGVVVTINYSAPLGWTFNRPAGIGNALIAKN